MNTSTTKICGLWGSGEAVKLITPVEEKLVPGELRSPTGLVISSGASLPAEMSYLENCTVEMQSKGKVNT